MLFNIRRVVISQFVLALTLSGVAQAQKSSIALEADILAYALPGWSGIVNYSHKSGLQAAVGVGAYELPKFLLKGDENYDAAQWTAKATSLQVARVTWRFNGPKANGPALGVVMLNQNMRLRSEPLDGETKFRQMSVGVTAGYYQHVGKNFYLYPTFAFTKNSVPSGSTSIDGTKYKVEKTGPNASLHVGWAF